MMVIEGLNAPLRDVPPPPPPPLSVPLRGVGSSVPAFAPPDDKKRPREAVRREKEDDGSLEIQHTLKQVGFLAQAIDENIDPARPVSSLLRRTAEALYRFVLRAVGKGSRPGDGVVPPAGLPSGVDLEA